MFRKSTSLRSWALLGVAAAAVSSPAWAQETRSFNIPEQDLSAALEAFGQQSDNAILFSMREARGRKAPAVQGELDPQSALQMLLADSGLVFRRPNDNTFVVEAAQDPQGGSGGAADGSVEALVVTAQKKEEQIQDVPIAISAFTQKSLDAQKLEGGFDLLKAIPNVSFSKNNFSSYNFSIRGIGTKAISATTDPGVAVSFNNSTLIVNRLFEQEYYDVERVEVLRGPQGTLFGRNATSGVINVLSARPRIGDYSADVEVEVGNYNARRVRGMVNIPIGDTFAVRLAGAATKRDGYGFNEAYDTAVDGRDLYSTRVTLGWEPSDRIRANLLWEHFAEDDDRARTSKQLCHRDPGLSDVGDYNFVADTSEEVIGLPIWQAITSQGCLPGSLYDDGAYGTPNGASLPTISGLFLGSAFGLVAVGVVGMGFNPLYGSPDAPCDALRRTPFIVPIDLCRPDPYGGKVQSRDLRTIHSLIKPIYRATADVYEFNLEFDVGDNLSFTSQTVYVSDEYYASQDFNRFTTYPVFSDSAAACGNFEVLEGAPCEPGTYAGGFYNVSPGGVFTDPQLGPARTLVAQDLSKAESTQFNQEFRLASNYDGAVNFSIGANYTEFETRNDYYVFANTFSMITHFFPFNTHVSQEGNCGQIECVYVDPNPLEKINGEGHNYFRSANPYELTSSALFGEIYWNISDTVKITAGMRYSWDEKVFTPIPSQLLLFDYRNKLGDIPDTGPESCPSQDACNLAGTGIGGRGYPADPDIVQEWQEPTGRLIVDWQPDLGFTDESMFYASYSHGYKGGGANPAGIAAPSGIWNSRNSGRVAPATFEPEFIDAYELGTKNTLLGGALVLNGSAFYYDYKDYQVSKIVDRAAANENFDAQIWGLELEWMFAPTRNLRFNGAVGYLDTEIGDGEQSIDLMDRTQGGHQSFAGFDEWTVLKPWIASSSNCVVPMEVLEAALSNGDGIANMMWLCPGGSYNGNSFRPGFYSIPNYGHYDPDVEAPNGGAGFFADLGGYELPNAPHWTTSLGAQYRFGLPGGWEGTLRGDFYWQSQSFARVYNTQYDKLRAWTNSNLSLWFEQADWGVTAEVYVKNVFDETPITDAFLNSDDAALTTNVFTLDPRLVGVSVRKSF